MSRTPWVAAGMFAAVLMVAGSAGGHWRHDAVRNYHAEHERGTQGQDKGTTSHNSYVNIGCGMSGRVVATARTENFGDEVDEETCGIEQATQQCEEELGRGAVREGVHA